STRPATAWAASSPRRSASRLSPSSRLCSWPSSAVRPRLAGPPSHRVLCVPDRRREHVFRKHTRRAAKAAFSISLGVALLIGLVAAGGGAAGTTRPSAVTVTIGTKNFTEEFILGQLYKQALEAKGYKVDYKENIGSSELIDTAITSGKINFYPEYTGVIVLDLAKKSSPATAAATYAAAKSFEESRNLTLLNRTPFFDSDSFGMLTSTARKLHVTTIGQMKKVRHISYAGYPECKTRIT